MGDRQGARRCTRGGPRRLRGRAVLRAPRGSGAAHASSARCAATAGGSRGGTPSGRRRRRHHAVELPAHTRGGRHDSRAHRRQRRHRQARSADQPHRGVGRRPVPTSRAARWALLGGHRRRTDHGIGCHRLGRLRHVHRFERDGSHRRRALRATPHRLLARARWQERHDHPSRRRSRPRRRDRRAGMLRQYRPTVHGDGAHLRPRRRARGVPGPLHSARALAAHCDSPGLARRSRLPGLARAPGPRAGARR